MSTGWRSEAASAVHRVLAVGLACAGLVVTPPAMAEAPPRAPAHVDLESERPLADPLEENDALDQLNALADETRVRPLPEFKKFDAQAWWADREAIGLLETQFEVLQQLVLLIKRDPRGPRNHRAWGKKALASLRARAPGLERELGGLPSDPASAAQALTFRALPAYLARRGVLMLVRLQGTLNLTYRRILNIQPVSAIGSAPGLPRYSLWLGGTVSANAPSELLNEAAGLRQVVDTYYGQLVWEQDLWDKAREVFRQQAEIDAKAIQGEREPMREDWQPTRVAANNLFRRHRDTYLADEGFAQWAIPSLGIVAWKIAQVQRARRDTESHGAHLQQDKKTREVAFQFARAEGYVEALRLAPSTVSPLILRHILRQIVDAKDSPPPVPPISAWIVTDLLLSEIQARQAEYPQLMPEFSQLRPRVEITLRLPKLTPEQIHSLAEQIRMRYPTIPRVSLPDTLDTTDLFDKGYFAPKDEIGLALEKWAPAVFACMLVVGLLLRPRQWTYRNRRYDYFVKLLEEPIRRPLRNAQIRRALNAYKNDGPRAAWLALEKSGVSRTNVRRIRARYWKRFGKRVNKRKTRGISEAKLEHAESARSAAEFASKSKPQSKREAKGTVSVASEPAKPGSRSERMAQYQLEKEEQESLSASDNNSEATAPASEPVPERNPMQETDGAKQEADPETRTPTDAEIDLLQGVKLMPRAYEGLRKREHLGWKVFDKILDIRSGNAGKALRYKGARYFEKKVGKNMRLIYRRDDDGDVVVADFSTKNELVTSSGSVPINYFAQLNEEWSRREELVLRGDREAEARCILLGESEEDGTHTVARSTPAPMRGG